jgi:GNAT superfamily N-acetyltransferase
MKIRPLASGDQPRLAQLTTASWGSTRVASNGRLHDVTTQRGFVAVDQSGDWAGYTTFEIRDGAMEIVVLDTPQPGRGAGSALIAECVRKALTEHVERVWLVTTNDNTNALRFYQRRGFVLHALRVEAVDEARRRIKPTIPELGNDAIPIRDEIELELPRAIWEDFVARYGL